VNYLATLFAVAALFAASCSTSSGWTKDDTVGAMRVGRTIVAGQLQKAVDKGKIEPEVRDGALLIIDAAIEVYSANDMAGREAAPEAAVCHASDSVGEQLAKAGAPEEAAEVRLAIAEHK